MYEYQYLISWLLSFTISLYLLLKRPKTLSLKFLILFGFVTSLWETASFMYRGAATASDAAYYFRIMILTSHIVPPLYLLTIINIRERRNPKIMLLICIPVIMQAFLIYREDYISSFRFALTEYGWTYRISELHPSLVVSSVIFLGYLVGITLAFVILIRKAEFSFLKKKYQMLLFSFLLFQVFGIVLSNALIGFGLLNSAFLLGGLFKFLTFISIFCALTIKEKRIQLKPGNAQDFWEVYSSFLTFFYNSLISIDLGEGFFKFMNFVKNSGIEDHFSITKNRITLRENKDLDVFELIDRNLRFFSNEEINQRVIDRYLRVLKVAEQDLDWKFDELVRRHKKFLRSSDLIYGLSGHRFLEEETKDNSLKNLDDVEACLRIYKRILLSILSESPELIDRTQKIFSQYSISRDFEINDYGEVSICEAKSRALKNSRNEKVSKIIDELNDAISEVFGHIIKSNANIDILLMKLKHVLRLNKKKAEDLGIYPKLLGTLATKIPKSQIHKLYSDYLEELVEEKTRELKKAQEDLLRSQRLAAIGEAAAIVSHDIRNPLQAITYSLYLVKKELESFPNENLKEIVDVMEKQVEYINKIVSDLQYYAKPLKPSIRRTNLVKMIEEIISTVKIPETIRVEIDIEDIFTDFPTDPVLIKRALINLIMNAIQAMENGGLLRIRAHREGDYAFISIQDTGVGIPEENYEKIFQPLFTTKSKGQGLGLTVCKRIVEALHGSISFKSKVGKGTTFIIKLPLKVADQQIKVRSTIAK